MRKIYDTPRIMVYAVSLSMPLAQSPMSSNGKSIRLNGIESADAANAAARSYQFDDDDDDL